ncbi:MAG: hypothetical protein K6F33_01760 [Bacteroidales bacterium]|nr:hypothetical protein [Bacteroidales bacterium]
MDHNVLHIAETWTGKYFREECTAHSYEGRRIRVFTYGNGPIKVLAWSQMHGNEPTSTRALLQAMDYLANATPQEASLLQSALTITTIPLLNPDGYIRYDRRNAQGIDINRDAQSLISPEARLLMDTWQRTKPDFALNLHDQETRYTSLTPPTPALLAMLAPECSFHKAITPARERAMKLIAGVANALKDIADNRIAKYDDVYTPTAFGDTFMKLGTSSILIEAGADANGLCQSACTAMSKAIISALMLMATGDYSKYHVQEYDNLPLNLDNDGLEMILQGVTIQDPLGAYTVDIGIRRVKPTCNPEDFIDDLNDYRVLNIGLLNDKPSLCTKDLKGYTLVGSHNDLRIGRKADFEVCAPDGKIINVHTLLPNHQH